MVRSPGQLGKSIYTQPLNILSSPQAFYLCIQIISLNWIQPSLSCCQAVTMVGRNSLAGSIWIAVTLTLFALNVYLQGAEGATFVVTNQCPYTVWAAASPGGGQALEQGKTWTFDVAAGTTQARVWGRTGCSFDANGQGKCNTGDCGGLLKCQGYGSPPQTLFEYALNQYQNQDFYDMSLIEGFNIPLTATPSNCQKIGCTNDIIAACPAELKVTGGCNGPCAQLNTPQYCCTGNYADNNCVPNNYSEFFKGQCPQAYSYPKDDATSTFTCPSGANYNVVFCG